MVKKNKVMSTPYSPYNLNKAKNCWSISADFCIVKINKLVIKMLSIFYKKQ